MASRYDLIAAICDECRQSRPGNLKVELATNDMPTELECLVWAGPTRCKMDCTGWQGKGVAMPVEGFYDRREAEDVAALPGNALDRPPPNLFFRIAGNGDTHSTGNDLCTKANTQNDFALVNRPAHQLNFFF